MAHPTDDELEAVAQRLELVGPTDVEAVDMLRACKTGDAPYHSKLVSTLSAAILDAQIRVIENRNLDTPDQIRANARAFLDRHQKGPSHD